MDNNGLENGSENIQVPVELVQQQAERMLSQSQVNEIVGNAKREAAEKAVESFKRQQAQAMPTQAPQQNYDPSPRGVSSEDDIKRVAGDEIKRHLSKLEQDAQERANVDAANRIVAMFKDKIDAGKGKFEDFESVAGNVAMQYYPNVVQLLAEHVDNTADVLYHLAKNRDKLYRLESLSSHNASDAIFEMKRLAESIKLNNESSGLKQANSPLSQQRPSNTGTDSNTSLSISDFKRKYRG